MSQQAIDNFTLPATGGAAFNLADYRGKIVVLYFYPKDSTPGCTTEAQQFRDLYPQFSAANCVVVGVSRDSLKSHEAFKAKQALSFELISDADEVLCQRFSVIKDKQMYGKPVRGIERSTFVIDQNGRSCREWRAVKADGHAAEVLEFVRSMT